MSINHLFKAPYATKGHNADKYFKPLFLAISSIIEVANREGQCNQSAKKQNIYVVDNNQFRLNLLLFSIHIEIYSAFS